MNTATLQPGDLIECNVRGVRFQAKVRSKPDGLVGIDPVDPKRYSWRFVGARQVAKRLKQAGAAA